SIKMIAGAFSRAWAKRSRTRAAPTPTNISTNSEPLIEKNGTPASPATARAEAAILLLVFEEIDDFFELGLCLVDARHVVEGDLGVGLDIDLGLAASDRHEAAAEALLIGKAPEHEIPHAKEQQRRQHPGEDGGKPIALYGA